MDGLTDIQTSQTSFDSWRPGGGRAKRSCTRLFRAIPRSRAKVLALDQEKTHSRPDLRGVHCREQGTLDQDQINCKSKRHESEHAGKDECLEESCKVGTVAKSARKAMRIN